MGLLEGDTSRERAGSLCRVGARAKDRYAPRPAPTSAYVAVHIGSGAFPRAFPRMVPPQQCILPLAVAPSQRGWCDCVIASRSPGGTGHPLATEPPRPQAPSACVMGRGLGSVSLGTVAVPTWLHAAAGQCVGVGCPGPAVGAMNLAEPRIPVYRPT